MRFLVHGRARRHLLTMVLGAGALALASDAGAQTPAAGEALPTAPAVPSVSAVGPVVKSALADAAKSALSGLPGAATPAASAPLPVVKPQDPLSTQQRLALLRHKVMRDEDFVESDDQNRDPFRSYLRLFVEKTAPKSRTVPAIFEKFALEELGLIAIVSGDANPRAMFRDPSGLGQVVKKGDYVSKSAARVTKILSDRVILEFTEITPNGESRTSEKAILVNPEAAQK